MAAIYSNEQDGVTVGITDLSRCTDLDRIYSMIRYLRDVVDCDLIILSNTSHEEIRDHTNLLNLLEPGALSYMCTSTHRRCIPFHRNNRGSYMFADALMNQPHRKSPMHSRVDIDSTEIWEQLRVRPFKEGKMMEDNLGWAPGILKNGDDGGWERMGGFSFCDIHNWFIDQ
jgi:hypothetical protein